MAAKNDQDLETVVITGASRGIGAAIARALAAPDRRVVLIARSTEALSTLAQEIERDGGQAEYFPTDLCDASALDALLDELDRTPPPRTLVLNAGWAASRSFLESDPDDHRREIELNYLAPARILRRVVPRMIEAGGGRVAVVGSLSALTSFPGNATYAASKAALAGLVRTLRMELPESIALTLVLPGLTDTEMTKSYSSRVLRPMSTEVVARAIIEGIEAASPLVVPGTTNRVAAAIFKRLPEVGDGIVSRFGRWLIPQGDAAEEER